MDKAEFNDYIDEVPDEVLGQLAASMPWASITGEDVHLKDEDGFPLTPFSDYKKFHELQEECWKKFQDNPQINSHVRDYMGNLTGYGFCMDSDIQDISVVMKEITEDPRNSLYRNITKFVARSEIEGELFLCLTLHSDGFVEVDFMSPMNLTSSGYLSSGIYYHLDKNTFPLYYEFDLNKGISGESETKMVIPSINIAYFPELANYYVKNFKEINTDLLKKSRTSSRKYSKIGNFKRFIIEWDKGFLTTRNVSHLRTTLVWINHYENLKKWEIDHKKSAGSYLWVASISDAKAFRTWLKLTDEQKRDTGLFAKKKPGGTLVLPPGITLECKNPSLPNISDADTDVMSMVVSGLNRPEDMVTGQTKGSTFSGVKASRGPQADRIQDQISYFDKFLRLDFWRPIFLLRNAVLPSCKLEYSVQETVEFKDKKPVTKKVKKPIHDLIYIEYPVSEVSNLTDKASAYLGVKHTSLAESLGIPKEEIAKKLGFGNYRKKRLQYATENENYPDLPTTIELETMQEKAGEANPGQVPNKPGVEPPIPNKPVPTKEKVPGKQVPTK